MNVEQIILIIKNIGNCIMKVEYVQWLLTFLIGIFVAFVGYQQYRVSKERFKLDLFEKRFSVYKGIQVFLTHILTNAKFEMADLFKFRADTQDAIFLFGEDVINYISLIDKKALEFGSLSQELEGIPKGEERSKACEEKTRLLMWLIDQLPRLKDVFSPYLKFKTWK
jgi:hypothetical protein